MAPSRAASGAALPMWDPILIVSQMIAMQTFHYLTLSLIVPPLLAIFAEPVSLDYEGGATSIGMIMDWREMAGRTSLRGVQGAPSVWSGGRKLGASFEHSLRPPARIDPARGWVIAFSWLLASAADIYYLSMLVRRPRLILDFAVTLLGIHIVLTTYYAAAFPTAAFWWLVVCAGTAASVTGAESICVQREMREGLSVGLADTEEDSEEMELGMRRD